MTGTQTTPPSPTSVAGIEAELQRLWREIAEQPSDSPHVVTRVCTLTLIAYGADSGLVKRIRKATPAVYARHPSRAILIEATGEPNDLSAWVTTVCQMPSGDQQQVCCEQITLTVGEQVRRRLPGTVLPLVVPDLPIFVWWPGPLHPASNVRNQLYAHADRWIIDSADFTDPLNDLAAVHTLIAHDPHTAISDLAWARLTLWRTLIARCFDHPLTRPALDALTTVVINASGRRAGALLSVGWLASSLGWKLVDRTDHGATFTLSFRAAHGEVQITLGNRTPSDDRAGSIDLTSLAVPALEISIGRSSTGSALICTVMAGEEQIISHAGALRPADDGSLLNDELNMYSHDRSYEQALAVVAEIAGLGNRM